MQNTTYIKLLDEVEKLSHTDQLRFLEQIAVLIRRKATVKTRRSILELQGLGKEIWQNIDVQKYVDEERKAWNGQIRKDPPAGYPQGLPANEGEDGGRCG